MTPWALSALGGWGSSTGWHVWPGFKVGRGHSAGASDAQSFCHLLYPAPGPKASFMGHLHSLFSLPGALFLQKPECQAPQILQVSPQRIQPSIPDYHVLNSKSNHLPTHTLIKPQWLVLLRSTHHKPPYLHRNSVWTGPGHDFPLIVLLSSE